MDARKIKSRQQIEFFWSNFKNCYKHSFTKKDFRSDSGSMLRPEEKWPLFQPKNDETIFHFRFLQVWV